MLAKHPPFRAKSMDGLYKKICSGKFKKIPSYYSDDLLTLIKLMLQVRPRNRPSATELLEHPVIKNHLHLLDSSIVEPDLKESDSQLDISLLKTIKLHSRNATCF